jgi:4a-hydroxytetrahydrobiopterin dehydratase
MGDLDWQKTTPKAASRKHVHCVLLRYPMELMIHGELSHVGVAMSSGQREDDMMGLRLLMADRQRNL